MHGSPVFQRQRLEPCSLFQSAFMSTTSPQCACCSRKITVLPLHYICDPCFADVTRVETESDIDDGSDELTDSDDIVAEHIRDHIVPQRTVVGSHAARSRNAALDSLVEVATSDDEKMDSNAK